MTGSDDNARQEHVHSWQPVGMTRDTESAVICLGTTVPRGMTRDTESAVIYLGTTVPSRRTREIAVQSCSCGAVRKTVVSVGPWR